MTSHYPNRITGGRTNITPDALDADIRHLLQNRHITPAGLAQWCDQIEAVKRELAKLHESFEFMMAHRTGGQCLGMEGWRNSSLLSYAHQIQSTQHEFNGNIDVVAQRCQRILQKIADEKQQTAQMTLTMGVAA